MCFPQALAPCTNGTVPVAVASSGLSLSRLWIRVVNMELEATIGIVSSAIYECQRGFLHGMGSSVDSISSTNFTDYADSKPLSE